MKNNNNDTDDLLDDIEGLVNCNWEEVHEEFKTEEYKESIKQAVIPNFPYKDFYALMIDLVGNPDVPPQLEYLIHRFTANRSRVSTPAFENVWDMFTEYRGFTVLEACKCNGCRREYTVIAKTREMPSVESMDHPWYAADRTMEMTHERVCCNNCGKPFVHISGQVVGVFENRRVDNNDVKHKRRGNF